MEIVDVLIIGAGPAGSIAAFNLAQSGLKVILLDKAQFPRRKVCGGALTRKALDELPFDVTPVIHRAVDSGYLGFRGQNVCTIRADSPIAYLVDRTSFDAFLLEKAIQQGTDCIQQARVTAVNQTETGVIAQTTDGAYQGRFLIGADGVHSLVAQQAGFQKPSPTSICYEARLMQPENAGGNHLDTITFDFGTIWWGYGWVFPKRDHLNVGVFRNWPGRKVTRRHLLRYISQQPGLDESNIFDVRAFPGPLGGKPGPLHAGRMLLCGDAAGLADPWLGEGIFYALASGLMAAETIIQQAVSPETDLAAYSRKIQENFIRQFKYARRFAVLVNCFYRTNVNLLKNSETLQRMMVDLLTGQRTYEQVWRDLWVNFPRLIQKVFHLK